MKRIAVSLALALAAVCGFATLVVPVFAGAQQAPSAGEAPSVRASASDLTPKIDERIEVLSIVYRLAGDPEFNAPPRTAYSRAVDRHFAAYAHHPFIAYVRRLNQTLDQNGDEVGAWDVASLALHVGNAPTFSPLVPAGDEGGREGWDSRILLRPEMVAGLQQFYRDAECAAFFQSQAAYFQAVNSDVQRRSTSVNTQWLERFFATPRTETYTSVLSLLGGSDFGYVRVNFGDERRNTHTVFALSAFDRQGLPTGRDYEAMTRISLHEGIHAYANQLVDQNLASLSPAAEALLARPEVWSRVRESFYNNAPFLLRESMVRAVAIKYAEENGGGAEARERAIAAEERAGFVWMRGLVERLDYYEANRDVFPDMPAFMPELIAFFEEAQHAH